MMPPRNSSLNDDDDYVISLLKKDAVANQKRSLTNGLGSLLSKRATGNAPKPNTRFLKSIIRETDSHNAALKAKEAEDSKAKLKELRGSKRGRDEGADEGSSKRRRGQEKQGRWANVLGGLRGGEGRSGERRRKEVDAKDEEERSRRSHHDEDERKHEADGTDRPGQHSRGKTGSKSRHRSPSHRKERRRRSFSRSESPSRSPSRTNPQRINGASRESSDSDPLDSFLGPKPPPTSLPRGRGAFRPSGMDDRFDPAYDPKSDISLDQDEDRDDWDMALEALRDRAKWRSQGADRLRAAGFTEDEVRKWEKRGEKRSNGGEKDFEDIRWNKAGEKREWDRGKVVDEDGHVDVKADWK